MFLVLLCRGRTAPGLLLVRFVGDRGGYVSMMFGALIVPFIACVGMAVDLGRAHRVRAMAQNAIDSAVLAAGRAAQTNSSTPLTAASTAATNYFNAAKPTDVVSSTISFAGDSTNTNFTITATSWIQTPFLSVLSRISSATAEAGAPGTCSSKYACLKVTSTASASIGSGGNGGSSVEVSLMLDVTGSMQGSKITTLKSAAADLVDTIIWQDQSKYTSRVAIVPFAPAVDVGSGFFTAITNESLTFRQQPCVVDRTGTYAYTDEGPATGSWVPSYYTTMRSRSCDPSTSIIPLTSNKTTLKNAIASLRASGGTAGPLGTAFAWYMISPNWAGVWGTASAPGSYADLKSINANGVPKLLKFAVLMTDGDYNVMSGTSASQSAANSAALSTCTNMKAKGITIYTVGFELSGAAAKTLLTNCATTSAHFYDATSESALLAAFRDIALKISSLRLTN